METPPPELTLRRATRHALAEIPARLGQLQVNQTTPPNRTRVTGFVTRILDEHIIPGNLNIPESFLSPIPSPDEMVIQQRGRRRLPITWSPDDFKQNAILHQDGDRTPKKSPSKSSITLRSTPRKRLLLSDSIELEKSPDKCDKTTPKKSPLKYTPIVKKAKLDLTSGHMSTLQSSLKGLSQDQLIDLINGLIKNHPLLESEVKSNMPAPDLKPLEIKLNDMKRNIFKSFPSSRLSSRTDSTAFSRASTHLITFKKCLIEQEKMLMESQHWDRVLDYSILAWSYVKSTPLWDNYVHNNIRRQCFKSLANCCITALKRGDFDSNRCNELYNKMKGLVNDSVDMQPCLNLVQMKMR